MCRNPVIQVSCEDGLDLVWFLDFPQYLHLPFARSNSVLKKRDEVDFEKQAEYQCDKRGTMTAWREYYHLTTS